MDTLGDSKVYNDFYNPISSPLYQHEPAKLNRDVALRALWPNSLFSKVSLFPELWILRYPAHRYHAVPSPGFEPTTLWLRVRHPNHSATPPLLTLLILLTK
jgi:hypothetical protein